MPAIHVVGGPDPEQIRRDTWGHLDAEPGVPHAGVIVFAGGAFGCDQMILCADFENDTAGDGPWFYQHVHQWLCKQRTEPGTCYRWTGYYRHTGPDDETGEFVGTIETVTRFGTAPQA